MAMSRSAGSRLFTTRGPMEISPSLISSSPATMRSNVDLPQPEGPTMTTNSPSVMSALTPWMTLLTVLPARYCLTTFLKVMEAIIFPYPRGL